MANFWGIFFGCVDFLNTNATPRHTLLTGLEVLALDPQDL
jgi:hypothetical protein